MASKFQQKIKLMIKDGSKYTTKQFTSAEFYQVQSWIQVRIYKSG